MGERRMALTFVHVPKAGGTSVKRALGLSDGTPKHAPASCLTGTRFGFLRDPWARMASLYRWHCLHERASDRGSAEARRKTGFKRWLTQGEDWLGSDPVDGLWHDGRGWAPWTGKGWQAAYHWPAPPLQRRPAMWWLTGCTYIGRVETMQADLDRIMDAEGRPLARAPHTNRTNDTNWPDLYDAESVAFVARWHAADIEAGGYEAPI